MRRFPGGETIVLAVVSLGECRSCRLADAVGGFIAASDYRYSLLMIQL